ncbi:MAG TPA: ribosome assembly factor SBDS [archaeon]|nr:ribosome assembly factor SBDS [archaeon]
MDKAVVSRLTIAGQKFEVLVDPNKALELKKGMKLDMGEILAFPGIYRDVRNTERVADADLQKIFGTADVFRIAEKIIKQGELQLTTDQRRQMVEQKKNQVATIIAKKGINPQTNTPHPPQRILNAMDQVGINIDPFVDAELQVDRVVREIKVIIPLKFQNVTLQVKVPAQFAGKVYNIFKGSGTINSEQWLNDGSLQVTITILAGVQDEFFQKISGLAHGQYESKVVKREDV